MERNRSKKAKAFGASGRKSVKNQQRIENIPPMIRSQAIRTTVRRFRQSAILNNIAFSLTDGHSCFLVTTDLVGGAKPWVDMWRIKWIKFWLEDLTNVGTSLNVAVQTSDPTNTFSSPERVYSVSSRSTARPGNFIVKPLGKHDPLGGWKECSVVNVATALFSVSTNATSGVTMDICFDFIENITGLAPGFTASTATIGQSGVMGSTPIMGSNFQPQGINAL